MWLRCLFVVPIPFAWSNLETVEIFWACDNMLLCGDIARSCTISGHDMQMYKRIRDVPIVNDLHVKNVALITSSRLPCGCYHYSNARRWKMDLKKLFIVSVINKWQFLSHLVCMAFCIWVRTFVCNVRRDTVQIIESAFYFVLWEKNCIFFQLMPKAMKHC